MDIEPQVLIEAAKDSTILEPNATNTAIRRKGDFHLPDLEPKLQKKVKKEGENGTRNQLEEKKADDNVFDPVIVKVTVENATSKTWKDIQQYLKDKIGIEIPYARFNKVEGHFAVDKKQFSDSHLKDLEGGFELDGEKFSVAKCEGEDLKSFYDLHGYHFQNIVESSTKKKVDLSGKKKKGRNDSKGHRQSKQTKSVTLGKHTFDHIEKIKNTFKSLLQSTADNEEIKEPNHSLLHDLLKHHDNYETKVKDIKHFTAGPHPSYTETRCFFVVRNNGEKEDFSTTKCYNKLEKIIEGEDE